MSFIIEGIWLKVNVDGKECQVWWWRQGKSIKLNVSLIMKQRDRDKENKGYCVDNLYENRMTE